MISIRSTTSLLSNCPLYRHNDVIPALSTMTTMVTAQLYPTKTTTTAIRHHTSPAYRRYLQKQHGDYPVGRNVKGRVKPGFDSNCMGSETHISAEKPGIQVPTLPVAQALPCSFSEMNNDTLLTVAEMGNHSARIEVLKRHIMTVDQVNYQVACQTFEKICAKSKEGVFVQMLPYKIGIATSLFCAVAAVPMIFHEGTAVWFNHHFVTMDIPEPSDLDTCLEVGAWTWNWSEPPLGTASFILLCLQFSRAQIKNMGLKPYTAMLKERRAKKLAKAFPQYSPHFLHEFVETQPLYETIFNS